eukprot:TRINITY_DN12416_c2_g1_i4.p3 TRINITY_DN12416_c2_g1~~TRINITY_DN12416_c2_g1_i4.p3  ORF type:complete len:130 (-),score=3.28 TRINITY_DN12416_c2_g1_i4:792-1181(-)
MSTIILHASTNDDENWLHRTFISCELERQMATRIQRIIPLWRIRLENRRHRSGQGRSIYSSTAMVISVNAAKLPRQATKSSLVLVSCPRFTWRRRLGYTLGLSSTESGRSASPRSRSVFAQTATRCFGV